MLLIIGSLQWNPSDGVPCKESETTCNDDNVVQACMLEFII